MTQARVGTGRDGKKLYGRWAKIRHAVLERDGYRCQYCQTDEGVMHIDHLIAHTRGGGDDLSNLITACASCNLRKHNKTLLQWLVKDG